MLTDQEVLDSSFLDLSEPDQWRWLRLSTARRIRQIWKYRNGNPGGGHPYVANAVARGYLREEIEQLREYRQNNHREQS